MKIFWLNPQGEEVLIENDESLQMALEVSRKLYTPASTKLLSAVTGLQNSNSPIFTLRVIQRRSGFNPPDWRRQFRNKIYSADQLELYEEAARVNKEPQNLPNLENFTFSLRFPGDYQNAKIFSQEGWATFNIKDLKIVFS